MVAEEAVRSAELFLLLVNTVKEYAIYLMDPDGHVMTWNPGAERIKGYTPSEIIGQHFRAFYTPADRERHKPERALATARSEGRYEEEGWRVRKDGTMFWASVLITPLLNSHGGLAGFAKITRDLSQRKWAEDGRFGKLFHTAQNALAISTVEDGRFVEVNEGFLALTGYTRDELIGHTSTELGLVTPDMRARIVGVLQEQHSVQNVAGQIRTKHGDVREGLLSLQEIDFGGTRCLFASVEDVTEAKRLRAAIHSLSTPILTVADRLLVSPLIGVLDEPRTRQFTEQLLIAIRDRRAKCVVADLTGVPSIDPQAANRLIQTVEAAALLGARVIFSGISTATAAALTGLNVGLERVRTVSDLQSGIEEALAYIGLEILPFANL